MQPSNSFVHSYGHEHGTFPKSVRLRKRADFVSLSSSISKITVTGFLVVWQVNDKGMPRLGITVSKKIGSAVIRNKVKRLTREVFRHTILLLPPVDINVIARRESATMDFFSVQRELEKAFTHIGATTCLNVVCSM